MFTCAALVLTAIWVFDEPPKILMQSTATFFVVGLTSFLLWVTRILLEIKDRTK